MLPTTLPAPLRRHAKFIDAISDEREAGDGYWVYLLEGLICTESETHAIHEETPAECAARFQSVEPCGGECCAKPRCKFCGNPFRDGRSCDQHGAVKTVAIGCTSRVTA